MSIRSILHVDFKKRPCRSVGFKGQRPSSDKYSLCMLSNWRQAGWPCSYGETTVDTSNSN